MGSVNTFGVAGSYYFLYGASGSALVSSASGAVLASSVPQTVTLSLTGLAPDTTYVFSVVVSDIVGSAVSFPLSFVTEVPPVPLTGIQEQQSAQISDAAIPHFTWPFTVTTVGALVTEQDTDDDVSSCVDVIVNCTEGDFELDPSFGVPDLTFMNGPPDVSGYLSSINHWEPRATVSADVQMADDTGGAWNITITTES